METKQIHWEKLNEADSNGFACNTDQCPNGANVGLTDGIRERAYIDVQCWQHCPVEEEQVNGEV